jgi:DNA polymerase-3 subunit delta
MFSERGRRITPDAAELFVRGVGYDLRRITSEIDKALSFIGEKAVIERSDIEDVLSTTAETSVFDFLDSLAARDGRQAMRLLAELVGQGESVYGIHAMAVRQLREVIAAQSLAQRGETGSAALASYLKRQEWQVKRLPLYAKRFAPGEPAELIRVAAETEAEMKTSRDPRLAFELWVLRVCGV